MKQSIVFLFSLLLVHGTYASDPKAEYKLTTYFINDTSYDIDVVGINKAQIIHLPKTMRPEEELTKVELFGTKDGIFITSVTVVDTSSDQKKSYEQNNIVVKQINWDIANNVNCKQPKERSTFSFRFTDKIIKAFDEAEKVDNNGNITKALRNGLVEESGEGYKLKKSQFYFKDFKKNKIKTLQFINRLDRDIMIALNNDKKLIIPENKMGRIMVPVDFVLKSFSIDDKEVTNKAYIKQMNDIIAFTIPNHTCTVMDINYDLFSIPVVFHNDVDKELTLVINNKITIKLAPKKAKSYSRGTPAVPNPSDRRIKMVELPIPTPSQGSLFDLKINGKRINSEIVQELNNKIERTLEGEMPNIIINQELLDRGFSGAAYYNQ